MMGRNMIGAFAAAGLLVAAAAATAEEAPPVSVMALRSSAEPYTDTLLLRGRTEAMRRVDVRAETEGLVVSEPIRKGARVAEGEVLCRIDEGDNAAERAEALARLNEAEIEYQAAIRLADRGFGAEMTANTKAALREAAKARVLRSSIELERLQVRAPFAGVLETDTAELGEFMMRGGACASLIALDPIKLVGFAPELSVDLLREGALVRGRLVTGREVTGRITHVARSADRDTRTYLVEASVPNPDLSIRDGMTAEISVVLEGRPAHLLPQTALTLNDDGALGVRLHEDGVARFAPVEIVREVPDGVWVAGLADEVEVIVVGQEFVTDGNRVAVTLITREALR